MNERDELLRRVAEANPYPSGVDLPNAVANGRPPVDLLVNDQRPPKPESAQRRTGHVGGVWRGPLIAAGTAAAILVVISLSLLFIGNGTGDVVIEPAPTTTVPEIQDETTATPAPIKANWSHLGTVDDWLTEPVLFNGSFYATRKALAGDAQTNEDGVVEGHIEEVGELWTSLDGVNWSSADDGEPRPVSPDTPDDGAAVVVRRNPVGDRYGTLVAEGLWATSDGTSWREIPLRPSQDNWIPWVETGGLGWVVYSPPREATVEADASSLFQGPRHGNLGLWYTPDTEAWFEVTDLGPLADVVGETVDNDGEVIVVLNDGEVGVYDAAMIVRDADILVYVNIATSAGWGISNPHTEIWRLDLSPGEPTTAAIPTTTVEAAPTTVAPLPRIWDPVLATTRAKAVPTAAECPADSNPNAPGPTDQPRPWGAMWSNQAAVFDQHAGKVLFVAEQGDLWAFDVCANTWHESNPSQRPGETMLVYDLDSDVTLGFNNAFVWVYDANTNTATTRPIPTEYELVPPLGAVYDPQSGLVVLQTLAPGLVAYDVDSDTWTPIGQIAEDETYPPYLVGYIEATGQLVFLESSQQTGDALLVDPRTGESVAITGPEGGAFAGFGRMDYAVGTDSPFVENSSGGMSYLDPATLEWNRIDLSVGPARSGLLAALVGDPINDRIVWIYGYGSGFNGARFYDANGIWAIDLATNEWTQLLEPSGGRTWEAYTWVNPAAFGIEVELNPSTLPPVPGEYEIEIDVSQSEPWTLPWACPRLAGAVEPQLSTDTIDEPCSPLVSDISATVEYPTVVTVTVTDDIIRAGALTIAVNAAMGDWAGTALLTIDD